MATILKGCEVKKGKTTNTKVNILILVSPATQGLIPSKYATYLLYFPSAIWSAAKPDTSSGERRQKDAMKEQQSKSLCLKWNFVCHFFKSAAEFEINAYTKYADPERNPHLPCSPQPHAMQV